MTVLDAATIGSHWLANGGDPAAVTTAAAVALTQSGGDPALITPAGGYGLWGIGDAWFPTLGLTPVTVLDPDINALAAIAISGNGTDWSPWPTAHPDPAQASTATPIATLDAKSPAGIVAESLGGSVQAEGFTQAAPDPTPNLTQAGVAWASFQQFTYGDAYAYYNALQAYSNGVSGLPQ